jgi:hypothetical protein
MSIFSTAGQLDEMRRMLANYVRLPFSQDSIPGALMESVLSHVRGGGVLNTYDFVDVIRPESRCGWQVKSTKATTPVTWKRAKIPNALELIEASEQSEQGLQVLGDAIIDFCNEHALVSMSKYDLDEIGYSRLIARNNGQVTYFERLLCSQDAPYVFNPAEFTWQWSTPKRTIIKEQLPALHGTNRTTGKKWWAWHGRGEDQLHFSGESVWWPAEDHPHAFSFQLPSADDKLSFSQFMSLLQALDT